MPLVNTPLGSVEAVPFPGRVIKVGDSDKETVQKIQQQFVASYKGKSANLSETYTNEFADKAS